ncbi:hypothetical protein [Peribacillus butanolivorans]|uniref:Uncharacterized protein n=1 Tax=Peribacillus butanolivorans TaxID=421767 RepID=A0ABN5N300_9BACI|nr:hypothetical protein [Peribacillus butanolivorans]AXN39848.1 hypothetical protein DTO10_16765 [Peribacillus butanolivorans]
MAEYKSQYKELGFYVDGEFKRFSGGRFATEDEATIEALSNISDAQRVDEPKAEETPKPKQKAPAKKTSGK